VPTIEIFIEKLKKDTKIADTHCVDHWLFLLSKKKWKEIKNRPLNSQFVAQLTSEISTMTARGVTTQKMLFKKEKVNTAISAGKKLLQNIRAKAKELMALPA